MLLLLVTAEKGFGLVDYVDVAEFAAAVVLGLPVLIDPGEHDFHQEVLGGGSKTVEFEYDVTFQ